jgi:hypothetical protein
MRTLVGGDSSDKVSGYLDDGLCRSASLQRRYLILAIFMNGGDEVGIRIRYGI